MIYVLVIELCAVHVHIYLCVCASVNLCV